MTEESWHPYGWWGGPCVRCGGPTVETWERIAGRWVFYVASCYGECPAVVSRKFRAGMLPGQRREVAV